MSAASMPLVPAGDIGNHILPEAIIIVTGIIAALAVLIRVMSRYLIKGLGIADVMLAISLAFYGVHHYNAYQAAIYPGLGVHQWQYNATLAQASKYDFKSGSIFFGLNIVFLKIAILLDWLRIFAPAGTKNRNPLFYILHTLIWANAAFYLAGTIIEALACAPTVKNCPIDAVKYNIASGIINVISDLTILTSPHWVIWHLVMSTPRKVGISVLFLIGILATASAVVRVIYVANAYKTGDVLFYEVTINLWAIAEETFGYLVIGIPAIPKVFQSIPFAKHWGSFSRRSSKQRTISGNHERIRTWGSSSQRAPRDPWAVTDNDTHVLVTIEGGEDKVPSMPVEVHDLAKQDTRALSSDAEDEPRYHAV
ncbi:hypothetical protein F5Y16DRAFT_216508 [Xylariaceae sp. FL0255]|nr:hypothetical protein F5Y16DRAFT_216508 [Xylariaceae sp. FL0255]